MKVDVLNIEGKSTGRSVELPAEVFGIEPNEHAVYLAVKQHNANQRQGTHSAKERNAIKGSSRKLKRQKGTGTARAGDIKNPLFRGGGRVFGPRPRTYSIRLNKKVKALPKRSALSAKASKDQIKVIEDFTFDQPKTSEFVGTLQNLGVADGKVLLVSGDYDKVLYLSGRNLKNAKVLAAKDISTYDVLNASNLVLAESSIEVISKALK